MKEFKLEELISLIQGRGGFGEYLESIGIKLTESYKSHGVYCYISQELTILVYPDSIIIIMLSNHQRVVYQSHIL